MTNNENINNIKNSLKLEDYLNRNGFELMKAGKDSKTTTCPLCGHKDCFRMTPSKQMWKCFSCDQGGDVIELHRLRKNLQVKEAIVDLAAQQGMPIKLASNQEQEQGKKKGKSNIKDILTVAADYYHKTARTSAGFKAFLAYRSFTWLIADKLNLGYADGCLFHHLETLGFTPEEMIKSGLVKQNENGGGLYDYFRYQVIYPTYDRRGQKVIHLKGKGIDRDGKPTNKTWQTGSRSCFFNWNNEPKAEERNTTHWNQQEKKTIYIVEGENDVVSLEKIGLIAWAIGGTLSQEQMDIITSFLCSDGSEKGEQPDFCFIPDNDAAGDKTLLKIKHKFKLCTLPDVLRRFAAPGMQKVTARQPNPDFNDIDEAIREEKGNLQGDHEKGNLQGDHEKGKGILNRLTRPVSICPSLKECLTIYHKTIEENEIKYSANTMGQIIYACLEDIGNFFIINDDAWFIYQGNQYQVGGNLPFKSLMYQLSEGQINYADKQSKVIWESIQAQCYYKSSHTEHRGWIHTDHNHMNLNTPAIYYNLCCPKNEVIRISSGKIERLMNGCNDAAIFLQKSPKTRPINLMNLTDEEMQQGLQEFYNIFFNNMACDIAWRIYIISLIINSIFLNMAKAHGINKFTGHQGSGKTEAAGMITALLYGQNFVTVGSTASDYTDAALNPVTICDNLEIHNITPDRRDFLLCVATGITRQKRKSGTDSSNIYEKTVTQIITTSIESFELPELIERAITIPFDKEYFNSNYKGSIAVETEIIAKRDLILSSIFKLATHILTNFEQKKERFYNYMEKSHPNHCKKRLNEHFAVLAVITDDFLKWTPEARNIYHMPTPTIISEWLTQQDRENSEIMTETNIIVRYLELLAQESANGLLSEYHIKNLAAPQGAIGGYHHNYQEDSPSEDLTIELTTAQLLSVFELIAKKYNLRHRFSSVRHLSVRIRNEISVIEAAGWSVEQTRRIKGQNLFEISNVAI
ncbi:putative DNA primase [Desulfamplus magnetovallimortis]|uniref:Putative DNA primase n=1 Tax=Desulfamplus magnetovallimortis TaxID=1246637 RepID=A0A1W1H5R9_9BACT|nr:CHC2 zinc finger domain-containing protein [Desulfamplus magnetovallimortis]SLM27830.1 putative DNA primase [Desulfamplus magnetovallimortis]